MQKTNLNIHFLGLIAIGLGILVTNCSKKPAEDPHAAMSGMRGPMNDPHAGLQMPQMQQTQAAQVEGGVVRIEKLTGKLPAGWSSVPPASTMRKAEFSLAPMEGDPEPGQMTVFYFGPSAGGIEANIQRWFGQFEQPDGKPTAETAQRQEFEVNGMKVILVQFTGTMSPSAMPGAPAVGRKEGWMNISAILQTPDGPWFFKGTGPEKSMRSHLERFKQFLASLTYEGGAHGAEIQ